MNNMRNAFCNPMAIHLLYAQQDKPLGGVASKRHCEFHTALGSFVWGPAGTPNTVGSDWPQKWFPPTRRGRYGAQFRRQTFFLPAEIRHLLPWSTVEQMIRCFSLLWKYIAAGAHVLLVLSDGHNCNRQQQPGPRQQNLWAAVMILWAPMMCVRYRISNL